MIVIIALLLTACTWKTKSNSRAHASSPDVPEESVTELIDDDTLKICVWRDGKWSPDWMQKYAEYARTGGELRDTAIWTIYDEWGLVHIDDDTIPEMVFVCNYECNGTLVLTCHNGEVSEWNSWRCGGYYIPRSGLIRDANGSYGSEWDRLFKLRKGHFDTIYQVVRSIHPEISFFYQGKQSSSKGYDAVLSALALRDSIIDVYGFVDSLSVDLNSMDRTFLTGLLNISRNRPVSVSIKYAK